MQLLQDPYLVTILLCIVLLRLVLRIFVVYLIDQVHECVNAGLSTGYRQEIIMTYIFEHALPIL